MQKRPIPEKDAFELHLRQTNIAFTNRPNVDLANDRADMGPGDIVLRPNDGVDMGPGDLHDSQ